MNLERGKATAGEEREILCIWKSEFSEREGYSRRGGRDCCAFGRVNLVRGKAIAGEEGETAVHLEE